MERNPFERAIYPDYTLLSGRTLTFTRMENGAQHCEPTTGPAELTHAEWAEYCAAVVKSPIKQRRDDPNEETRQSYKTAYHAGLGHFCSIVRYDLADDSYLVNFGHRDVWMDANELTRFCF